MNVSVESRNGRRTVKLQGSGRVGILNQGKLYHGDRRGERYITLWFDEFPNTRQVTNRRVYVDIFEDEFEKIKAGFEAHPESREEPTT